jgi:hypothetical protein
MTDIRSPTPEPVAIPLLPGAVVAGYSLLRQVAGAGEAGAWLARAPDAQETVCITVQRDTEALNRRVAAQGRIRSSHVLALLDLATDADGRVVLACERTDWTLATLLSSRASVAPGEAVTILAPLIAGLAAIHRSGLCHGGLTPATVLFCPDGRPVLGGLDALQEIPGADPDDDRPPPGMVADLRSLAGLIVAVSLMVDEVARTGFSDIADWMDDRLRDGSPVGSLLGQVECRLFALAPALPVVLVADRSPAAGSSTGMRGSRSGSGLSAVSARPATDARSALRRATSAVARSGAGDWLGRALRGRALAVSFGIVLLVAALLAGLAAIPDRAPVSTGPMSEGGPPSEPARPAPADPAASIDPAPTVDPTASEPLTGEDPVAATASLLRMRARCLDAATPGCVSGYAEPASALATADLHALGTARRSPQLLVDDAARVQLVQSYGDAVLIQALPANEKRQPVLVLAVRTDTGWRLRDVFEPD